MKSIFISFYVILNGSEQFTLFYKPFQTVLYRIKLINIEFIP